MCTTWDGVQVSLAGHSTAELRYGYQWVPIRTVVLSYAFAATPESQYCLGSGAFHFVLWFTSRSFVGFPRNSNYSLSLSSVGNHLRMEHVRITIWSFARRRQVNTRQPDCGSCSRHVNLYVGNLAWLARIFTEVASPGNTRMLFLGGSRWHRKRKQSGWEAAKVAIDHHFTRV